MLSNQLPIKYQLVEIWLYDDSIITQHCQVWSVLTADCAVWWLVGARPVFMFYHVGVTLVTVRPHHWLQGPVPGGKPAWDSPSHCHTVGRPGDLCWGNGTRRCQKSRRYRSSNLICLRTTWTDQCTDKTIFNKQIRSDLKHFPVRNILEQKHFVGWRDRSRSLPG